MSSFIGKSFGIYNADSFAESFRTDSIYLYFGKTSSWPDDTSPPVANNTTTEHNKIWDNMVGALRVTRDQVALGIKRNDWKSGAKYEYYHHANTSLDNFYVLAGVEDRDVYKCMDNNGRVPSSVKPNHRNYGYTKEKDGYVWKYMYSIGHSDFRRFATTGVIPVIVDTAVASVGSPRSVVHIPIAANNVTGIGAYYRGQGFVNTSFSAPFVNASIQTTVFANSSIKEITIVADSGLALMDNYYTNSIFFVTSGKARGTFRRISSSQAHVSLNNDKTTNLFFDFAVSNFANGDTFIIGPKVKIDDMNGEGFIGFGKTNQQGNVISINVSHLGRNYANGDAIVKVNGSYHPTSNNFADPTGGQIASPELILSPPGGHGSNPFIELEAKYVIISPETPVVKDHETGIFAGYGNEIRQVGLLSNPVDRATLGRAFGGSGSVRASSSPGQADFASYDLKTTIYFAYPTDIKFKKDDVVFTTGTSDPTSLPSSSENRPRGVVYSVCGDSNYQYISLSQVQGRFYDGQTLYNETGESQVISSVNLENYSYPLNSIFKEYNREKTEWITKKNTPVYPVIEGGLTKYTGDIMYHENISPITRTLDQKENFKFIFEF